MAWYPVNINFNKSPPDCPQINMPAIENGAHQWEGIQFNSSSKSCKFTGINITNDKGNSVTEWPAPTISSDGQTMQQQDLYLDTAPSNHAFTIYYTDNGVAKSFDPGIQNQD